LKQSDKLSNINFKKIIFYIIWAFILYYLYAQFAKTNPFGENSAFYQIGCKSSKENISKDVIKYKGF